MSNDVSHFLVHSLYLIVTDILPGLVFILIYQRQIQGLIKEAVLEFNLKVNARYKRRKMVEAQVGTGDDLLVRYTLSKRKLDEHNTKR